MLHGVPAFRSHVIVAFPGDFAVEGKLVIVTTFAPLLIVLHALATGAGRSMADLLS